MFITVYLPQCWTTTNKLLCLFVLTLYPSPHWVGQVNIWLWWWWKSWIPALQQTHLVLDSRFPASSLGPASVWSIQSMPDCLPAQSGNQASSWLPCLLWAFKSNMCFLFLGTPCTAEEQPHTHCDLPVPVDLVHSLWNLLSKNFPHQLTCLPTFPWLCSPTQNK